MNDVVIQLYTNYKAYQPTDKLLYKQTKVSAESELLSKQSKEGWVFGCAQNFPVSYPGMDLVFGLLSMHSDIQQLIIA